MKAVHGNVIIQPDWEAEDKVGSIWMPQIRHRELPNTGTVVARPREDSYEFVQGDRVIFNRLNQQIFEHNGKRLTRVKLKDVLAIIDK